VTESQVSLRVATPSDLSQLTGLIRAYHEFEGISSNSARVRSAVSPLLGNSELGRVWLINSAEHLAGYLAICFGYSIELGGRDAFVDEMYVSEPYRGQGIAARALRLVQAEAMRLGVVALHLEVSRGNEIAQRLYRKAGFVGREQYFLMSCHPR